MASTFDPGSVAPLGGADWSSRMRVAAAEQLSSMSLPTTEEEVWRYSRIDELDLDRYGPAAVETTVEHGDLGRARVARASELPDGEEIVAGREAPTSAIGWLRSALLVDPVVVDVPDGVRLTEPVVVRHRGATAGTAAAPVVIVRAGADSEVSVVEVLEGGGDGLVLPSTDVRVGPAGRVGYVGMQALAETSWAIGTLELVAESQATVTAGLAGFGGDYARLRTDCHLNGRGATGDLLAAYFGTGTQALDYRTFQEHVAPDTTSNLLFKGAVGDHARSVYTGRIRVHPDGRGTNAFQTNRNLKLSEHAWADSVPNLEIENNDVRCSHASTVGPVDEDQRFYLESRGVPPRVADRLIVGGFFDEVLVQLPVPELLPRLRAHIIDRFAEVEDLAVDPAEAPA